jgi:hypothetical protein
MSLVYAFRIHLATFAVFLVFAIFGLVVGPEKANAAVHTPVPEFIITTAMWLWMLSWLWLLIQSWVMLVRSWKTRVSGENAKLFFILFIFSFFGAYYFYWKRYEIDPKLI